MSSLTVQCELSNCNSHRSVSFIGKCLVFVLLGARVSEGEGVRLHPEALLPLAQRARAPQAYWESEMSQDLIKYGKIQMKRNGLSLQL